MKSNKPSKGKLASFLEFGKEVTKEIDWGTVWEMVSPTQTNSDKNERVAEDVTRTILSMGSDKPSKKQVLTGVITVVLMSAPVIFSAYNKEKERDPDFKSRTTNERLKRVRKSVVKTTWEVFKERMTDKLFDLASGAINGIYKFMFKSKAKKSREDAKFRETFEDDLNINAQSDKVLKQWVRREAIRNRVPGAGSVSAEPTEAEFQFLLEELTTVYNSKGYEEPIPGLLDEGIEEGMIGYDEPDEKELIKHVTRLYNTLGVEDDEDSIFQKSRMREVTNNLASKDDRNFKQRVQEVSEKVAYAREQGFAVQ